LLSEKVSRRDCDRNWPRPDSRLEVRVSDRQEPAVDQPAVDRAHGADQEELDAITQMMGISVNELMAAAQETAKKLRRRIPRQEIACAWRDSNPQPSDP
jgi:hypothetical protein